MNPTEIASALERFDRFAEQCEARGMIQVRVRPTRGLTTVEWQTARKCYARELQRRIEHGVLAERGRR